MSISRGHYENIHLGYFVASPYQSNRFIWQRSEEYIYPAKEIIFARYYNRNETETGLAGKLKQASNILYPFRIYEICLYIFRQY